MADVRKDYSKTLLIDAGRSSRDLKEALRAMHELGQTELQAEGFKRSEIQSADFVDLRYHGQSYELTVKLAPNCLEAFHKLHEQRYGYANPGRRVELVSARSSFWGRTVKPELVKAPKRRGDPKPVDMQPVWIDRQRVKTRIYDRAMLAHGHRIKGPAIIGEYSSTTLVPAGFQCAIDAYLNLVLTS
jgi:N-methylhydantoinase A